MQITPVVQSFDFPRLNVENLPMPLTAEPLHRPLAAGT